MDDGAVCGGVARDLGVRTGIDPLWFRLAFVGLTAFSGLGVVLYLGSWALLRGQSRSRVSWLSVLGVVVIVGGCIVLLGETGTSYVDSPWTIVLVLAGATVALWQPRAGNVRADERTVAAVGAVAPSPTPAAVPRRRRPPSYLGRVTLAIALLVAAAGAVGYQIAGDGLHPERWLGAAAAVCGAGMVVGAWRGRALWLVVPGLLFAASGFVAGHAARAEIDEFEVGTRDFRTSSSTDALPAREDLVAGEITVTVDDAPPATRSDLRIGLGVIEIVVDDDVALEVRAHVHSGDIVVDGDERPNDGDPLTLRFGPTEPADVVIYATISVGELRINPREVVGLRPAPVNPPVEEG